MLHCIFMMRACKQYIIFNFEKNRCRFWVNYVSPYTHICRQAAALDGLGPSLNKKKNMLGILYSEMCVSRTIFNIRTVLMGSLLLFSFFKFYVYVQPCGLGQTLSVFYL